MIKDLSVNSVIEVGSIVKTSSFANFVYDAMYDFYNTKEGRELFEGLVGGENNA